MELYKKNEIAQCAKKISKQVANARKVQLQNLQKKLSEMDQNINKKQHVVTLNMHQEIERQIKIITEKQVESSAFRLRCKYLKDYERNSKFFFSLEKKNYNCKTMVQLRDDSSELISDSNKILEMQKNYYQELYTSDKNTKFSLFNTTDIKLTGNKKKELDEEITMEEVTAAVKSLKTNKVGGLDGFSAKFYQFFWSKIKHLYFAALKFAIKNQTFHQAVVTGLIILIPKKDKNSLFLKNWHPLTMLCIEYKILAKLLATRIKRVLPSIISEMQSGFMENRQISLTLRTTLDITKDVKNLHGYVLLLDFEKCFNHIEYHAIRGALRYFNFGEKYISLVNLLLQNFQSCCTNNGYLTDTFDVTQSCHQGCNLTRYLYLLCGEVLAHQIKNNSTIQGIKINDLENLIAQFADDTQLFLQT